MQVPRGAIRYYEQTTGKDSLVVEIGKPWLYLSVSPDEQEFLYSSFRHSGSDLMLLDNFR